MNPPRRSKSPGKGKPREASAIEWNPALGDVGFDPTWQPGSDAGLQASFDPSLGSVGLNPSASPELRTGYDPEADDMGLEVKIDPKLK